MGTHTYFLLGHTSRMKNTNFYTFIPCKDQEQERGGQENIRAVLLGEGEGEGESRRSREQEKKET